MLKRELNSMILLLGQILTTTEFMLMTWEHSYALFKEVTFKGRGSSTCSRTLLRLFVSKGRDI